MLPLLVMAAGMVAQEGAQAAQSAINANTQVSIANTQASAMLLATQAQANAAVVSAQAQANVMIKDSDNRLTAIKDTDDVQKLQTQQFALTARFQSMASMAERLDKNATVLQIAAKGAQISAREERNRHTETMAQLKLESHQNEVEAANSVDLLRN